MKNKYGMYTFRNTTSITWSSPNDSRGITLCSIDTRYSGGNIVSKPENVKCPICNGPMVSRKSKYGVFWGCVQFPNCKGTRDSMGQSKEDREQNRGDNRDWETNRQDRWNK